jgi:hypothetical protein
VEDRIVRDEVIVEVADFQVVHHLVEAFLVVEGDDEVVQKVGNSFISLCFNLWGY